ncbi:MAG: two-component system NarL family sensor kinase [Algoriphagus sp.]|jgi:two-component system NarL family sensor kinase
MKNKMSIKLWIIICVNALLIPTILLISLLFYQEFKNSLDERVLLQLTSIKRLKRIQVEDWLNRTWSDFTKDKGEFEEETILTFQEVQNMTGKVSTDGIYDVTKSLGTGKLSLLFLKRESENKYRVAFKDVQNIDRILQERSGMGQTGESYIVGDDFRLRTRSRFITNKLPYEIKCKTEGVLSALKDEKGHAIILDYRGKEVYSAFHSIKISHINWVILSEIDTEEALSPLYVLRKKLLIILLGVFILAFMLSIILAKFITKPVIKMKTYLDLMSKGNYQFLLTKDTVGSEIEMMYEALDQMLIKIRSTINFSKEIGDNNLDAEYKLIGSNDTLGESLLSMRQRLRTAQEAESIKQKELKRAIVTGQEKERLRLSKDLHDGLGPMLTQLKLLIQSQSLPNEKKEELKQIIDDTVSEVRRMTFNLMPQSLLDFGLIKALQNLVIMLKPISKARIEFIYHSRPNTSKLAEDISISLFRIAQECLNNGIKHAQATQIIFVITDQGDNLNLYYSDDGKGFTKNLVSGGSGLRNMQTRVDVLDGKFDIDTGKEGTNIDITIPLN